MFWKDGKQSISTYILGGGGGWGGVGGGKVLKPEAPPGRPIPNILYTVQ